MTLNELRQRFSTLYRHVPAFECSPGWLPILHELSIILAHFATYLDQEAWLDFSVGKIQASEGVFEVEIINPTPQMLTYVKLARSNALSTCEICGEMGKKRTKKNLTSVRCEECKK